MWGVSDCCRIKSVLSVHWPWTVLFIIFASAPRNIYLSVTFFSPGPLYGDPASSTGLSCVKWRSMWDSREGCGRKDKYNTTVGEWKWKVTLQWFRNSDWLTTKMGNGSAKQANSDVASVIVNNESVAVHNEEIVIYLRILTIVLLLQTLFKFFKHYNRMRSAMRAKPVFSISQQ